MKGRYVPAMKTPSKPLSVIVPAILLALFAAGGLVARALALPLPATVVGLGLVLLGLRIGVIAAVIEEPAGASARPSATDAGARLRAANG
jgi:hypothetical protein